MKPLADSPPTPLFFGASLDRRNHFISCVKPGFGQCVSATRIFSRFLILPFHLRSGETICIFFLTKSVASSTMSLQSPVPSQPDNYFRTNCGYEFNGCKWTEMPAVSLQLVCKGQVSTSLELKRIRTKITSKQITTTPGWLLNLKTKRFKHSSEKFLTHDAQSCQTPQEGICTSVFSSNFLLRKGHYSTGSVSL